MEGSAAAGRRHIVIAVYSKPSRLTVDAEPRDSKQTSPATKGQSLSRASLRRSSKRVCIAQLQVVRLCDLAVDPIPGVEVCPAMPQLSSLINLISAEVFGQRIGDIYCFGL